MDAPSRNISLPSSSIFMEEDGAWGGQPAIGTPQLVDQDAAYGRQPPIGTPQLVDQDVAYGGQHPVGTRPSNTSQCQFGAQDGAWGGGYPAISTNRDPTYADPNSNRSSSYTPPSQIGDQDGPYGGLFAISDPPNSNRPSSSTPPSQVGDKDCAWGYNQYSALVPRGIYRYDGDDDKLSLKKCLTSPIEFMEQNGLNTIPLYGKPMDRNVQEYMNGTSSRRGSLSPINAGLSVQYNAFFNNRSNIAKPAQCVNCSRSVSNHCFTCNGDFCINCANLHILTHGISHQMESMNSALSVRPIGTGAIPRVPRHNNPSSQPPPPPNIKNFCLIHTQVFEATCYTCSKYICQLCKTSYCEEHNFVSITDVMKELDGLIYEVNTFVEFVTTACRHHIDIFTRMSTKGDRYYSDGAVKVKKFLKRLIGGIADMDKKCVEALCSMHNQKIKDLEPKSNNLGKVLAGVTELQIKTYALLEYNTIPRLCIKNARYSSYEEMKKLLQQLNENLIREEIIDLVPDRSPNAKSTGKVCYVPLEPARPFKEYTLEHIFKRKKSTSIIPNRKAECIPGGQPVVVQEPIRTSLPILSFALTGFEDGEVNRPWGLCFDKHGNFIVGDRRNNRIQIFAPNGMLKLKFGEKGTMNGQFLLPSGICVNKQSQIIVVDKDNHRVQVFNELGQFLFKFGSFGREFGQFQYPWDVAVNNNGNIVVTDSRNHRVQLFNARGKFINMYSFEGSHHDRNLKGVTSPRGCCFTPKGDIIITDFDNSRILLLDGNLQRLKASRGFEGATDTAFYRPAGIVCDDAGNIIIADGKNQRVVVCSPGAEYGWHFKIPIMSDKHRPTDVALTPHGNIAVLIGDVPELKDFNYKSLCIHVY